MERGCLTITLAVAHVNAVRALRHYLAHDALDPASRRFTVCVCGHWTGPCQSLGSACGVGAPCLPAQGQRPQPVNQPAQRQFNPRHHPQNTRHIGIAPGPLQQAPDALGHRLRQDRQAFAWDPQSGRAPGRTTLTITPLPRSSRNSDVVKVSTNDLLAAYSAAPWLGRLPTTEPTLIIAPWPRCFIAARYSRVSRGSTPFNRGQVHQRATKA